MPDGLPPPPNNPYGHAPLRRAHSVRRTSSLDMSWPDGRGEPMRMIGRARDIYTPAAGAEPIVLREDAMEARIGWDRTIHALSVSPERPAAARLVGHRGGGNLRGALDRTLPAERDNATPLYLMLDDIAGASLMAGWVWMMWLKEWGPPPELKRQDGPPRPHRVMEGVCTGYAPGSSALTAEGGPRSGQNTTPVGSMVHPQDPAGWHALHESEGVDSRRARRIDVWLSDVIEIEATFQDSGAAPEGGRRAMHEYGLRATVDRESHKLLTVEADPRTLPYRECPSAALNVNRLIGTPMSELRLAVLHTLRGTAGCTHLNDALRALAEAPALAALLERERARAT